MERVNWRRPRLGEHVHTRKLLISRVAPAEHVHVGKKVGMYMYLARDLNLRLTTFPCEARARLHI